MWLSVWFPLNKWKFMMKLLISCAQPTLISSPMLFFSFQLADHWMLINIFSILISYDILYFIQISVVSCDFLLEFKSKRQTNTFFFWLFLGFSQWHILMRNTISCVVTSNFRIGLIYWKSFRYTPFKSNIFPLNHKMNFPAVFAAKERHFN